MRVSEEAWLVIVVALVAFLGLVYSLAPGVTRSGRAAVSSPVLQAAVPAFPDCMDTDGGFYAAQVGSTYNKYASYDEMHTDYCKDVQTLVEYFCDQFGVNSEELPCQNSCQDGVCL